MYTRLINRGLLRAVRRASYFLCPINRLQTTGYGSNGSNDFVCFNHEPSMGLKKQFSSFAVQDISQFVDSCEVNSNVLHLAWKDGREDIFHSEFLRSLCECDQCMHKTGQRLSTFADAPDSLCIGEISYDDYGISIQWLPDRHMSYYSYSWLQKHSYSSASLSCSTRLCKTQPLSNSTEIKKYAYEDIMRKDSELGLYNFLQSLIMDGVSIIRNTPCETGEVGRVASRISILSHSFMYGDIFDVISKPNPENIAYTSEGLRPHMDLAYYESPPGVQFLHCIEFDEEITGGESTFVDTFLAAEILRKEDPEAFHTLSRVPATFKKHHKERDNPVLMDYQRPHINLNHQNEVVSVFWSPPFEGPLRVPADDVPKYYRAYKKFDNIIERLQPVLEFKLLPGDLVAFNQRRMLHGRRGFSLNSSGARHLQGCYLNIDEVLSKYRILKDSICPGDSLLNGIRISNGSFT